MSTGSFTHVVACVDDSDFSANVIRLAERVVKTGGTISVVHVLGGPPFSESVVAAIGGAFGGSPLMDNTSSHREIAQALLESVCEDIPGAVPVVIDAHDADSAPDAVVRWAEDNEVDAIVVAAHTRALDRALKFMGSFSGHLVHHAPCPVVLLPHGLTFGGDS
jgi:nucleotide-binding universal stress UspA family protein